MFVGFKQIQTMIVGQRVKLFPIGVVFSFVRQNETR